MNKYQGVDVIQDKCVAFKKFSETNEECCSVECAIRCACLVATFNNSVCNLYDKESIYFLIESDRNIVLFVKKE